MLSYYADESFCLVKELRSHRLSFVNSWAHAAYPTVRPLMPDALPALHLLDAFNPLDIFEARPTGFSGFAV